MKVERSYSIIYNPKSSPKKSKHTQSVLKLSYLQEVTSSYVYKCYLNSSLIITENFTEVYTVKLKFYIREWHDENAIMSFYFLFDI